MHRRTWFPILTLSIVLVGLLGCTAGPPAPSISAPQATETPLVASTPPPPPRPTAAPPALSAPASPAPVHRVSLSPTPRPLARPRVGRLGTLNDVGVLIGLGKAFYVEQGLEVQVVDLSSPREALIALSSGQLDVASLPISVELLSTLGRGINLKIVAEAAGAPPGHGAGGLSVRPDLIQRLKTPTDLRGFRIALPARGESLDVELWALLKQGWLARSDVETLVLPYADTARALADGSLDAAMVSEPGLTELQLRGLGLTWRRSDRIVPDHLTAALVFSSRFAYLQPDSARRFVVAYLKALRLYNDVFIKRSAVDRADLIDILSRGTAIADSAELDRVVLPGMNPNGMVNVETLRLDQQYFLLSGQMPKPVDLASAVDAQYAAYAITQLGEYR